MLVMKISRKYRRTGDGILRCANLQCQAPLEPPVTVHEFNIGMSKKLYCRPFCVECTRKLKKAKENVVVEVA
jgi:aspartate carbamoyltransferase regulatory subunit